MSARAFRLRCIDRPAACTQVLGPATTMTSAPASRAAAAMAEAHLSGAAITDGNAPGIECAHASDPRCAALRMPASGPVGAMALTTACRRVRSAFEHAARRRLRRRPGLLRRATTLHAARLAWRRWPAVGRIRPHHAIHRGRPNNGRRSRNWSQVPRRSSAWPVAERDHEVGGGGRDHRLKSAQRAGTRCGTSPSRLQDPTDRCALPGRRQPGKSSA